MKKQFGKTFKKIALASAITSVASAPLYAAQLEEIIVTAQKRAESLQDVSVSITSINGDLIEDAGIHTLNELAAYVPNLIISETAVSTSITLRGVGPGANQSFEQSVGLYLDGVHLSKGRQSRIGLFDLEQIEVLRGPQGILFGKNTLAGAVNVTSATANPGDPLSGELSVNAESFGGFIFEGNVEGSLSENLALRFAYKQRETDGYLDNSFPDSAIGNTSVGVDETLWRFSANYTPSDDVSIKLRHTHGDFARIGSTAVVRSVREGVGAIGSASTLLYGVLGAVYPQVAANVQAGSFDVFRDSVSVGGQDLAQSLGINRTTERPEGTDTTNNDTSLNVDIDFGDGYTFSSVTGLSSYEYDDGIDADFLPVQFVGRSDISDYDHFSQEIRIASNPDNRFSYIAGAYIETKTQEIDRVVAFDGTLGVPQVLSVTPGVMSPSILALSPAALAGLANPALEGLGLTPLADADGNALSPGIPGLTFFNQLARVSNWKQDTDSWAVFFQGEYRITDNLTLIGGLRYTQEDKDSIASVRLTSDTNGLATPLAALNSRAAEVILDGFDLPIEPHDFSGSRSTDQVTPAVILEWQQSDNNLFYANYSEGFKSGGFNAVDDQAATASQTNSLLQATRSNGIATTPGLGFEYDDETAYSFEIGGKHTLFNDAMTLNWAAFTSEYDDQQVSTFVGVGFVVTNAASSEISGLEVDMLWQATDNLRLGLNAAYLDAAYGAFEGAGCTASQSSDLLGQERALGVADITADGDVLTLSSGRCSADYTVTQDPEDSTAVVVESPGEAQDLSGVRVPQTPEFSGALFANYEIPVNGSFNFFFDGEIVFSDSYFLTGDVDPLDAQDSFTKYNARIGLRSDDWELMLYGRNLSDEITATSGFDVPLASGTHAIYANEGRVIGARVSYSFSK